MYLRLILITLILSYVSSTNNCALYVIDSEFKPALNLVNCDDGSNQTPWTIVNIKHENIRPKYNDSTHALFSSTDSCAHIEVGFLSEGTLEADVFVSSGSCEINIGIADAVKSNKSPSTSSQIKTANTDFDSGWRIISVVIEKDIINALITLQAACQDGHVLVSTFKHIPLGSSEKHCKQVVKQKLSNFNTTEDSPGPQNNAEDTDVVITKTLRNDEESSFWTPLTISLITLSIAIVLAVLAVSAYQCGKSKGLDEVNNIFWNESDMTLTIPRARSIYNQSVTRSQHSGQFP